MINNSLARLSEGENKKAIIGKNKKRYIRYIKT